MSTATRCEVRGALLKAKFSYMARDLYWSLYDMQDGRIQWFGYDDANWWQNVAPSEQAKVRIGKSGKRYEIDFRTEEVAVTEPVAA